MKVLSELMPALLTRMSRWPNLAQDVLGHPERVRVVAHVGPGQDGPAAHLADRPRRPTRAADLAGDVVDRDVGAFLGERERDRRRPIPREPPVTSAVRPFSFMDADLLGALEMRQSSMRALLVRCDAHGVKLGCTRWRTSSSATRTRKLYDTQESRYVTLEEIEEMIRGGREISVRGRRLGRGPDLRHADPDHPGERAHPAREPAASAFLHQLIKHGESWQDFVQKSMRSSLRGRRLEPARHGADLPRLVNPRGVGAMLGPTPRRRTATTRRHRRGLRQAARGSDGPARPAPLARGTASEAQGRIQTTRAAYAAAA